ncbi:MAG: hypothetical protein N2489_08710 [Clostridia bacterium]|nr:hypothetical protein [Clostridia bacterium]
MNTTKNKNEMNSYFEFDDEKKEVLFKRHDMPTPWMNYFSNGTFHTMLSHAGGGVSFYKSPQIWRIGRYRFYHLPVDRSGPYIYIKDAETGKYWCPTYEPAGLKPEKWKAAHGLGYSRFNAEYEGLRAELLYFVGGLENSLIWNLKLFNSSSLKKKLKLYAFVEFGMMEFLEEIKWQCYIKHQVDVNYLDSAGAMVYRYHVQSHPKPEETPLVYMASNLMPSGFDGDRDAFIGNYRSEMNPEAVEVSCRNSTLMGGDPCAALEFEVEIDSGKEEIINVFLGTALNEQELIKSVEASRAVGFVEKSFNNLCNEWSSYLEKFSAQLPDKDMERIINIWNPYQVHRNFLFSRNISFYATGTVRGVGFRDTAQDILGIVPFDLQSAKDKARMLLKEQYKDGHANHYFYPNEGWEPVKSIHSDDHLWLILTVSSIVLESGSIEFLNECIEFYDGGEATVYEHLKRAVGYTDAHLGPNGFPLMLRSDWNDMLYKVCKEGRGESIWTSMQYGTVLQKIAELARIQGLYEDEKYFLSLYDKQKNLINKLAWDGKWFIRAVMDNGEYLGTSKMNEAKIWLNSQTWSIISGMEEQGRGKMAMDSVKELLDTELGIKKIHPSIRSFPTPNEPLTNYNPGTGENGSVFCHANTWAVIAECILGRSDIAYKYYRQLIPNVAMEKAGIMRYKAEPYVYSSNLFGPESDKFGFANVSWLTGTAAWMYIAATQYILGIRAEWEGLSIKPCIPEAWSGFKAKRVFRGCVYNINVERNTLKKDKEASIIVDGVVNEGFTIKHVDGRKEANVYVIV